MRAARALLLLGGVCGLATCAEPTPSGPGGPGFASLALRIAPPPALSRVGPALVVAKVNAAVVRFVNDLPDTLADQSALFDVNAQSVSLQFRVLIPGPEDVEVEVEYLTDQDQVLFLTQQFLTLSPGELARPALDPPYYIGPGSNIASLSLTPLDTTMNAGDALTFQVAAIDSTQQPVPSFYVSWSSSDPRVPINALGEVRPPDITKIITISAATPAPNSTVARTTLTILGSAALGITPDSVEKLPGGTEQFTVTVGATRTSSFIWSVNGVDGGDATFGAIDGTGFYTAPAAVPNPSSFKVCAREATNAARNGCAVVVIAQVPSAGGDLIVINDQNLFDSTAMQPDSFPGNARFVRNILSFSGTGPRSTGTVVYYDRGRNSPCYQDGECGDPGQARFDSVVTAAGYSIVKLDSYTHLASIPSNVKVLMLWTPLIAYDTVEVNTLKQFAAQGGRIVFIGEWLNFYTAAGIALENQFLADMGAQMTNLGTSVDCAGYVTLPKTSLRSHPLLNGVDSLRIACASVIQPGPNDYPLFYDSSNTQLIAGVAKIDLAPLPAPPVGLRLPPRPMALPGRGTTSGRGD
ncbi:MAG TPA: hypothetical protein VNH46_14005 [Gemmatimonadales bacterium]|nr:hypothetical protein [Gemmatimonadales bacterium]